MSFSCSRYILGFISFLFSLTVPPSCMHVLTLLFFSLSFFRFSIPLSHFLPLFLVAFFLHCFSHSLKVLLLFFTHFLFFLVACTFFFYCFLDVQKFHSKLSFLRLFFCTFSLRFCLSPFSKFNFLNSFTH